MNLSKHLAKHIRDVHFGGNWTVVNLKDTLSDITWQQATQKVESFNTIAILTYHINYFLDVVIRALKDGVLEGNDKLSFSHPPIASQQDWQDMLDRSWANAGELAALVELLPDEKLWDSFFNEKYGNYYRNIQGIIEHTHYHMGQIVIIKKMLNKSDQARE